MIPLLLALAMSQETLPPKAKPVPAPGLAATLKAPKTLALPALTEAEKNPKPKDERLAMAGVHRRLKDGGVKAGAWQKLPGGQSIWRMSVRSPGAAGLRLHFTKFGVADGRVWVHDGKQSFGPYTGDGPLGGGDFWSDSVYSETVTVEYQPAKPGTGKPPFLIPEVSHLFQ